MISGYIDRIEEDLAVILTEDEEYQINYPAALLPDNVGEGDYITIDIFYDEEKTNEKIERDDKHMVLCGHTEFFFKICRVYIILVQCHRI